MLFMGEEFGEDNPFLYFVSHSDEALIRAVREGRKKEFEGFAWHQEPIDPQSEDPFLRSKLDWSKLAQGGHAAIYGFYRALIALRKAEPVFRNFSRQDLSVKILSERVILLERWYNASQFLLVLNFDPHSRHIDVVPRQPLTKQIDSAEGSRLPATIAGPMSLELSGFQAAAYSNRRSLGE
jgi:maltooligosyltrehalose trehalohydrolase